MNVNGMTQHKKRCKIFNFLLAKKPDITFLQETHSTVKSEALFSSLCSNRIYFAHGESNAKGVAIAFSSKLSIEIVRTTTHAGGRYIIMDVKISDQLFTLINIYAPNDDAPEFFLKMIEDQKTHDNTNIVLGGDFNLVLDITMDSTNINRQNNS